MPKLRPVPANPTIPPPASVQDLCDATGLGENTVREAIKLGQLPGYYIGRKVVIPRELFERFCRGDWTPRPVRIEALTVETEGAA